MEDFRFKEGLRTCVLIFQHFSLPDRNLGSGTQTLASFMHSIDFSTFSMTIMDLRQESTLKTRSKLDSELNVGHPTRISSTLRVLIDRRRGTKRKKERERERER